MNKRSIAMLVTALLALEAHCQAFAQDTSMGGLWEGPWYRGMTSGKVKIDLRQTTRTIQFTNLDGFGTQMRPLEASLDSGAVQLRAEGDKGGALTANLKLNEAGTEMKGLGKFDGFPLRFEVKRAN